MGYLRFLCGVIIALPLSLPAAADTELIPFAGFRMGGEFDTSDRSDDSEGQVDLKDTESYGIVLNVDLAEPGK